MFTSNRNLNIAPLPLISWRKPNLKIYNTTHSVHFNICIFKILREKAKKGKARDDCPPRLPKGLEQMLRLIYQICADHKPLDIFKFIAKKLENRLNQRTLGENAELDYYYENEDDDFYREEFKSSKRVSMERDSSEEEKMTFASDTIPTEVFMSAYHNSETRL